MSISVAPLGSLGSKLSLKAAALPKLDAEFEKITEGEELTKKESRAAWDAARQTERSAARRVQESRGDDCINRKTKWAALEALVGNPKRIALVAADLVAHFEKRVEATRRMSNEEFRMSNWVNVAIRTSAFALRLTGSADDGPAWQKHIRSKDARRKLANRFKDAKDAFIDRDRARHVADRL